MVFYKIQIRILLSIILLLHHCNAQAELDFPDKSILSPQPDSSVRARSLRICNTDDAFSNSYCNCTAQVVSCDFSQFTVANANITYNGSTNVNVTNTEPNDNTSEAESYKNVNLELSLYGYQFPKTASRICICNTPPNLHLTFSNEHFLPFVDANNIQRFDLFNLSGITHFMGGFNRNFHGDLYIANVSQIPKIQGLEFGRGVDDPIRNVQNQECCSPIKLDQNLKKPLLFVENSTIDHVETRGISDDHLWKTIIFKSSVFKNVSTEGIIFTSNMGLDAAILRCTFENVFFNGIIFQNTANVFLAKNSFKNTNLAKVHSGFLMAKSSLNNSNILLMNNLFWNEIYMNLDARHIIGWYNLFDLWDSVTFEAMNLTSFSSSSFHEGDLTGAGNRSVSFRYNIINWVELGGKSIDFGNGSTVTLSDNVLGTCNCSTTFALKDTGIKPELNWCYTGSVSRKNGKCSLKLDAAKRHCNGSHADDFEELCNDKKISSSTFPGVGSNLTVDVGEMDIKSEFVSRIVEQFHPLFGLNIVTKLLKGKGVSTENVTSEEHNDGKWSNSSKPDNSISREDSSQKKNVTTPVVITIIVVFILAVGIFIMYKHKHRFLRRFGHQELIGSRNELI